MFRHLCSDIYVSGSDEFLHSIQGAAEVVVQAEMECRNYLL